MHKHPIRVIFGPSTRLEGRTQKSSPTADADLTGAALVATTYNRTAAGYTLTGDTDLDAVFRPELTHTAFRAAQSTCRRRRPTHTIHALLTLCAAGEASASAAELRVGAARTIHAGLSCLTALSAAWRGATRATAALAHPAHAFLSLFAAIEAATAVPLVPLQVYAPAFAAGLSRAATVGAAAAVALVGKQVYAPISAASLPF